MVLNGPWLERVPEVRVVSQHTLIVGRAITGLGAFV
jgi:hypothetical protein